jgi:tRNA pseudouridine38-40 synthase
MPRYLLELAYDGGPFFGWQSQPHGNTVQDVLEAALARASGQAVRIGGAARTDTGVHAAQQFAAFDGPEGLDLAAVQAQLPAAIRLRGVREIPPGTHPTRMVAAKRYCYRIRLCGVRDGGEHPRHWAVRKPLDATVLAAELSSVAGTRDFTSFCAADSAARSKVRALPAVEVAQAGDEIALWFSGHGFLKQMLRILVGSAVACAAGDRAARPLLAILAERDRRSAGRAAPAQGLTLEAILLKP